MNQPENISEKLASLERLSKIMDSQFNILGFKFGFDALIGIVPIAGNVITTLIAGYNVWQGSQLGVPKELVQKMIGNVIIDTVMSAVPIVGNIGDFFWRANDKNLVLMREYFNDL